MSALPGVFSVRRPNMLGPIPPGAAGARRKWPSRVMNPVLSTQSPSPAPRNPGQERNRARVSSGCDPHTTHAATPPHPTCPKRSPPHPKQPIFTSSHQSGRRFEHQPDDSPPTQRPNRGFCYHRPPTRRRHAARSLLWSQFPPHLRVGTHLKHNHIDRDTLNTGYLRTPLAHSAVHLGYNSPFSPVLTKVDDGLSSKPKLRPS